MRRPPAGGGRATPAAALASAGELNPEWSPWLRLIHRVVEQLGDPGWIVEVGLDPSRAPDAPLLDRAILAIPERDARQWTAALLDAAGADSSDAQDGPSIAPHASRVMAAIPLLEAAIRVDEYRLAELAMVADSEPDAVGAVAQLAVMPLLFGARRRLAREIPTGWGHGWCPVCGTWPVLAEMRGLDRERHLRCGRCGSGWRTEVLLCPFCEERDHRALGGLLPEGEEETRRIDTCKSCKGYVKTITTLMAIPDAQLPAEDVATIPLDLAAMERGFSRPGRPGRVPGVQLAPMAAGLSSTFADRQWVLSA